VEDVAVAPGLELVQQFVNVVIQILCHGEQQRELADHEGPNRSLLVVVLNVDVYDVDGTVVLRGLVLHILYNLIINLLLACEDDIKLVLRLLEPLWPLLDASVAVEHVQKAVLSVQELVLGRQVLVDEVVRGAELVAVGLVRARTGEFHLVASAVGLHREALLLQHSVRLHGPVHVGGARHSEPQLGGHGEGGEE